MISYDILKRFKDSNGNVTSYMIVDNNSGKKDTVSKIDAQKLSTFIRNARLIKSGEYIAKKGCSIDTEVDTSNLLAVRKVNKISDNVKNNIDIDFYGKEFINICRRIRQCAILGNIRVDTSSHKSNGGNNINMFKLIEACGISVQDFVKGYLSVLQPYSLSKFMGTKNIGKDNVWIVDIGYRVKLVIKIENFTDIHKETVIISFHESNLHGATRYGPSNFNDKRCAVILDTIGDKESDMYTVSYTVQRGFMRHVIKSYTPFVNKDIGLVKYSDINTKFADSMNMIIEKINSLYYDNEARLDTINTFNILSIDDISFLSFGYHTVNNISYIIDLYSKYNGLSERSILTDLATNIIEELTPDRKLEMKQGLIDKYKDSNNKLYKALIERM